MAAKPNLQNGGKKCKFKRKSLDGCRAAGYNDRVKSESAIAALFREVLALTATGDFQIQPAANARIVGEKSLRKEG